MFAGLIEYNNTNIFCKQKEKNDAGKLVPDVFLIFKKALFEVKESGPQLRFNII